MRETYKTIPKLGRGVRSARLSETQPSHGGQASLGAARRWSTATQSITGHASTASHQSLHAAEHGQ